MMLLVLAGSAYLFAVDPAQGVMPKCMFHELTGLHCPGCGASRALHALLHGQVMRAIGFNPLLMLALPWIAHLLGRQTFRAIAGMPTTPLCANLSARTIWIIGGVLVGFGVLRNLPWWPFTLLAP
jgi:hypothetical protein